MEDERINSGRVVIIDDTDPIKGRIAFQEVVKYSYFDTKNGYGQKVYRGASSGEEIEVGMQDDELSIATRGGREFSYNSVLNKDGSLEIMVNLIAINEDGQQRRSVLMPNYTSLVDHTFDYFERQGKQILEVRDGWNATWKGKPNSNWQAYLQGISDGLSPEQAAKLTPTGKVVGRHGFTEVSVTLQEEDLENDQEEGGLAVFTRPKNESVDK